MVVTLSGITQLSRPSMTLVSKTQQTHNSNNSKSISSLQEPAPTIIESNM